MLYTLMLFSFHHLLSPSTAHDQKSDTKAGQKQGSRGQYSLTAPNRPPVRYRKVASIVEPSFVVIGIDGGLLVEVGGGGVG